VDNYCRYKALLLLELNCRNVRRIFKMIGYKKIQTVVTSLILVLWPVITAVVRDVILGISTGDIKRSLC